jgi:hypothetical protein
MDQDKEEQLQSNRQLLMLTYQSRHDSPEDREKRRQWLEAWHNLPPLTLEEEATKNN